MTSESDVDLVDLVNLARGIGRIEGAQQLIIDKLNAMIKSQLQHEDDDRQLADELRDMIAVEKAAVDKRIKALEHAQASAKGAGFVILGLLGALATFVGGAVIAATGGHIRFL